MNTPDVPLPLHLWTKAVKNRDSHRCVKCESTDNLRAHHVVARIHGGQNLLENGETLCHTCHWASHRGAHTHGRPPVEREIPLVPLMVRLPQPLHTMLHALASTENRSLNAQVITLLQEAIAARERQQSPKPKK